MANFIQLPQAGGALPLLINTKDICTAHLCNKKLIVEVERDGVISMHESKPLPSEQGIALYWYLFSILNPVALELSLN